MQKYKNIKLSIGSIRENPSSCAKLSSKTPQNRKTEEIYVKKMNEFKN